MPNYYTNFNPAEAASSGLMAGFEFVERIRDRRRQRELQERQMGLAENADQRAQRGLEISEEERTRDNTREDVLDTQRNTLFSQQQSEFERGVRVRGEDEAARGALASGLLEGGGPSSLASIGAGGMQRPPANVPQNGQPPDVPQSAQSAGPVDLRAAQKAKDDSPNFVERLLSGPTEKSASKLWDSVADPNDNSAAILQGRGKAITTADIRRNPAQHADKYISERDKVSPAARASLDVTMASALKEQLAALDSNDQRNAPKIRSINTQLGQFAKASTNSAAADAGITRPIKIDDARLVPAITNAAAKARNAQEILETTPDELRAATTMVGRMGGSKRLNQKQISALTTLYAHGQIDAEQLNNWSKYGTPIAPKPPTVSAIGNGTAIIMTPDGQMTFVQAPGAAGAAKTLKDSEVRLRQKENMTTMFNAIKGAVEGGELEGDPGALFNEMLTTLGRTAGEVQQTRGIPLIDPRDNAVRFHEISATEAAELATGFVGFHNGEVDTPWYKFRQGKSFAEYLPQRGLATGAVIDGYQYLGGDPNDETSWQTAQ